MTSKPEMKTLKITRRFSAPIERVFDAWTKPEVLSQWFGPEHFIVLHAKIEAQEGGSYAIEMRSPDGMTIKHNGQYVRVIKPHTLIFTWILNDQACTGSTGIYAETLVSITLKTVGNATELTLIHEQLPNKEALDGHTYGWNSSFDALAHHIQNEA